MYYHWSFHIIILFQIILIVLWISFLKADKEYKEALNDYLEEMQKQLHNLK